MCHPAVGRAYTSYNNKSVVQIHSAPTCGREGGGAPVVPHQLRDDDEEEEELCDIGEEADEGADVVKDGLEALHARLEGREEGVVHHGGGVPEEVGLDDVTWGGHSQMTSAPGLNKVCLFLYKQQATI